MRLLVKNIISITIILSGLLANSQSVINIWHQMLYENRKALRDVCDEYETRNAITIATGI